MHPSKKSRNESINIEDLIDDEATVEDFEAYNEIYPEVESVEKLKNHCTSCFKHLGLSLAAVPKIRLHNILKVTVCKPCHEFYNSGEFERGEDGSELFCRWCGQGGVVFCCTKCIYVFCKDCIKRNLGSTAFKRIANNNEWSCFRCDSSQLIDLRARHHVFTNYLLNRQNYVNETAKNATELRTLLLEDMSTCCRSSTLNSLDISTAELKSLVSPAVAAAVASKKDKSPAQAGSSSSATKPVAVKVVHEKTKRPREFSPGTAPGPLSKKLKMKAAAAAPPPAKPVTIAPKPPAAYPSKRVVLPAPPQPQPPVPDAEDTDDQDLFSLLNPIVELQVEQQESVPDPIDPLDLNGSSTASNSPQMASPPMQTTQQQQQPMINSWQQQPLATQQFQNAPLNPPPDLDPSFGFGSHFMAFAAADYPPIYNVQPQAPVPQPRPTPIRMGPMEQMVRNPGPSALASRLIRTCRPVSHPPAPLPPPPQQQQQQPNPGDSSVFHYVNGFKIDLKAASEKQLITLPDGKVIHVRRHPTQTVNVPAPSGPRAPVLRTGYPANTTTFQVSTRPMGMRMGGVPPLRFNNNLTVRPVGTQNVIRPPRASLLQRPQLRPRRKTTTMIRTAVEDAAVVEVCKAKLKLHELMVKLSEAITYTTKKVTTFQNTNVYKGTKTIHDIMELHTNFSFILTYAQSRFSDIIGLNDNLLEDLHKQHSRDKPITEDELQLLEDRPACINLDSDEEGGEVEKAAPGIRCKTVTEINTTAVAGPSAVGIVSTKPTGLPASPLKKPVQPQKAVTRKNVSSEAVINLSDDEEEEEGESVQQENGKIIEDILDQLICSLFGEAENKENLPPSEGENENDKEVSTDGRMEKATEKEVPSDDVLVVKVADLEPISIDLDSTGPSSNDDKEDSVEAADKCPETEEPEKEDQAALVEAEKTAQEGPVSVEKEPETGKSDHPMESVPEVEKEPKDKETRECNDDESTSSTVEGKEKETNADKEVQMDIPAVKEVVDPMAVDLDYSGPSNGDEEVFVDAIDEFSEIQEPPQKDVEGINSTDKDATDIEIQPETGKSVEGDLPANSVPEEQEEPKDKSDNEKDTEKGLKCVETIVDLLDSPKKTDSEEKEKDTDPEKDDSSAAGHANEEELSKLDSSCEIISLGDSDDEDRFPELRLENDEDTNSPKDQDEAIAESMDVDDKAEEESPQSSPTVNGNGGGVGDVEDVTMEVDNDSAAAVPVPEKEKSMEDVFTALETLSKEIDISEALDSGKERVSVVVAGESLS